MGEVEVVREGGGERIRETWTISSGRGDEVEMLDWRVGSKGGKGRQ